MKATRSMIGLCRRSIAGLVAPTVAPVASEALCCVSGRAVWNTAMSRPAIVSVRFMSTPNPAPAAGTPTTPPSSTPTPAENPATNAANAATNLGSLTGSPPASNTDKAADHRAEGSPKPPSPSNIPKLYVGNLNWRATNEDLAQAFSQFGTVREAIVIMDRENPTRSRGFGFVTMSTMEEAEKAVKAMDQKTWLGRPVRVNLANLNTRPRPPQ